MEITSGLLTARGLPALTLERYQEVFDFPVRLYYERLGFDLEAESFEKLGSAFIEQYDRRRFACPLQAGTRRALETVRAAGLDQSILSAYKLHSLEEIVTHFGLRDFFIELIGLDDHYAAGKVEHGRAWMARLHHAPEDVLLVGDTVHDYEVAREMGTDCILITSRHHGRAKLETCGVPVLGSLAEFTRLIVST